MLSQLAIASGLPAERCESETTTSRTGRCPVLVVPRISAMVDLAHGRNQGVTVIRFSAGGDNGELASR
jgi:hypothetical protein